MRIKRKTNKNFRVYKKCKYIGVNKTLESKNVRNHISFS